MVGWELYRCDPLLRIEGERSPDSWAVII